MTMDWSRPDGENPADAAVGPALATHSSHTTAPPILSDVPGDHRLLRR